MKIFFILLFLLFPLGQLIKIPVFGRISVLPQELVILVGFLFWLVLEGKKISATPLLKPITVFATIGLLSLLLNPLHLKFLELLESGLYLVRFLLYFAVFAMAFSGLEQRSITKKFLIRGLLFSVTITSVLGLMQYFLYPQIANLAYLGWDVHYGRLVGTFFDPGFTGLIFVLGFFLLLASSVKKNVKFLGLALFFLCLLLTYSRSSYLAFVFGLGIYSFYTKNIKLFVAISSIFLLGIFLIPKPVGEGGNLRRTASSLARFGDWQQSLKIWQEHPILGVGFNAYRFAKEKYGFLPPNRSQVQSELINHALSGADNSFLFILATTGILGLLSYLNIWWKIMQKIAFTCSIIKNITAFKAVSLASFSALYLHTFFQNSLFYPFILEWMWILLAMTVKKKNI